jgi:hypothetical protein
MELSNLFSHPHRPELVPRDDRSTGPVENPTFSDRAEADGAVAATPPS